MLFKKFLNSRGHEVLSSKPKAIPLGMKRPETLQDQIKRLVRYESAQAAQNGLETWEEANDFDMDDPLDFVTPYEEQFDPLLERGVTPDEFRRHPEQFQEEFIRKTKVSKKPASSAAVDPQISKAEEDAQGGK